MNISLFIKIVGRWFVCIPLVLASAATSVLPFIVSPDLPAYFFHKGWVISFLGLGTVNFSISARRQYSRYKAFRAAWKDAAGEPRRKEKAPKAQRRSGRVNWPILITMSGCMAVTYYLVTITLALLQKSSTFADFVTAVRHDNDYLIAWSVWPLTFALEVYLLGRVFSRRLERWTATQSQWLLIPVALVTAGLFLAWVTAAPFADEYPFYVLAFVASGAVTFALYFPAQRKRAEKLRADNATIDGRRVPDSLVSISLAVPSHTPSPSLILAELPDYCLPLLRLQASPAYPGIPSSGRDRAGGNGTAQSLFEKLESFETTIQTVMESLSNKQKYKIAIGAAALVIGITIAVINERAESSPPGEHMQAVIQMEPAESKPRALEASLSTSTPLTLKTGPQIQARDDVSDELTPAQMTQLGNNYFIGNNGVAENKTLAVQWFMKAAEHGDADAERKLGLLYMAGDGGLPWDMSEAAKWFGKAAEQGNAQSQLLLGMLYVIGSGVPEKDEARGVELIKKAARQGDPSAQEFLQKIHVSWDK